MTLFFVLLCFSSESLAQLLPVGLYEGLMGNTGAATVHSTAASYYNPSLLRDRQDNAFSLNGNTLGTSNVRDGNSTISSALAISPSYLSTLLVGEDLVHEFFLATTLQGQFSSQAKTDNLISDAELNMNRVVSGYSMAFKAVPLALQFLARYTEGKIFGVSEFADANTSIQSVSKTKTDFKNLNFALGISSHFRFDHYTFGVNLVTRGLNLYTLNKGSTKSFVRGPQPSDYAITEVDSSGSSIPNEEGRVNIGHSFKVGYHEFLTDSVFAESSNNLNRYTFNQSFGYRYGLADNHQLLCGVGHNLGPDIQYAGQSFNASVGYSWATRRLRSAVGLYYSRSNVNLQTSAGGVVFGRQSEY